MSYCRWSNTDGGSDVYVYQSSRNNYVCHVARFRLDENGQQIKLDGPLAGSTIVASTPEAMTLALDMLKAIGYRVPLDCINQLLGEAKNKLGREARIDQIPETAAITQAALRKLSNRKEAR